MTDAQITKKLEAAVARGVKRLDKFNPGWYTKINLATLDLGEPSVCILGQTFKEFVGKVWRKSSWDDSFAPTTDGFAAGIILLSDVADNEGDFGFDLPDWLCDTSDMASNEQYDWLGQVWIRAIKAKWKAAKGQ